MAPALWWQPAFLMVLKVFFMRRYKKRDYALAAAITIGVMLFFLTGPVSSKQQRSQSDAVLWGTVLMLSYLGFDGFTSTFQDKLFKGYSMSTYNQMLYVNAFSAMVSFFGKIQVSHCSRHCCWQ
jgi:adenosine 3'-phospho 5'-phosphosulfate transporter B2